MIAGTALQAYSQYQKGKSEAAVADNNAVLVDRQGNDVLNRGEGQARKIEIAGEQIDASARTIQAAGNAVGVSVDNARIASSLNAAADAEVTRANAAREAWGYKAQAQDLRAQASATRKAGFLGSLGTVLGGAGSVGGYLGSRK